MSDLSLAAMERLLRKAGAVRIGEDAKQALRDALEEHGHRLAEKAVALAEHAGRNTVMGSDVKLAKR